MYGKFYEILTILYLLLIKCGIDVYGTCDNNIVVNTKLSFTIVEMSHIQYLHHICL